MAFGTALVFNILATNKASKTLTEVGRDTDKLGNKLGKLAGIAAGAALIGGATLLTSFIKDAAEAAKITRITENAIKVTGGAAKTTAKEIDVLARSLSNKTAVDDELIQTGANLLLTFKNIRNEAGAGNKIFNYATQAAVDLAAAGFGSVESAAKMLGKALNDPLKGLTALGKAGVTFSDQQKETIAKLVEQGNILGAQKIIMQEIATQVGGAAEAAASPLEQLKTTFGNLGEELGTVLLPYLEDFANWLIEEGVPKIEDAIVVFEEEWIPAIKAVWGDLQDNLIPILATALGWIEDNKDMVWLLVAALIAWKVQQGLVNLVMAANPLIGFLTLVASAILIINEMNDVTGDWHKTLETLALYIATVPILGPLFKAMADFDAAVARVWGNVKRAFEDGVRLVVANMFNFAESILDGAEAAFGWIPGVGPKLREAQTKLDEFRKATNTALSKISDEDIVINIKPGGLERVAKSAAASYAARYQGPGGGAGGGSVLRSFTPDDAVGGSLGLTTTGLNPEKIISLASKIGNQAGTRTFSELSRLFKAGAFASMFAAGPGIPGSGRLFPLPPGTYRRTQGPHDGGAIDYGAPYGTPVRASFTGQLQIGNLGNRSYGKFYRLFGAGQRSILGAHLSSFSHGNGPIQRGQMIGRVGSTGNSTGPHLHLLGFDKGGWLPTGMSMVYNGTGRPERVLPPSSSGGTVMLVNRGIIGSPVEMENWLARGVDTLKRQGRL